MKKSLLALFIVPALMGACTPKQSAETEAGTTGEYETTSDAADGVQRMHEYNFADTIVVDGHKYTYTIHREASDSLPIVVDDDGARYADNVYTLKIAADGREFFNRRFTKNAFASRLSNDFRQRGLLDGMMFDNSLPGLCFAVSVSMPQSDMVEPLLLKVDRQGGITIERDERSDADFDEDEEEGV